MVALISCRKKNDVRHGCIRNKEGYKLIFKRSGPKTQQRWYYPFLCWMVRPALSLRILSFRASLDDREPAVLTFHKLVKEKVSGDKLLFARSAGYRQWPRCGIAGATLIRPGTRFWKGFFRSVRPTRSAQQFLAARSQMEKN
jgi:hypothetical protein